MQRILIVGCGYVGQALAKFYLKQGAQVWALQRKPVNINGLKNILCDINLVSESVIPDVDVVFYLVSPDSSSEASYMDVYDSGINKLIAALRSKGSTKLIFSSSTRVYGQCQGEDVDENSITTPNEPLGKILLAGEKAVLADSNNIIVRFGGIYGPGRTKLLEEITHQRATLSPTTVYTNRIFLDDCVGVLQFVANLEQQSSLFLGVDSEPVLYNDMLKWLAHELNAPDPKMGETPPQRLINSNKRCLNHKIVSYGYEFQYPTFRDGYRKILNDIK